MSVVNTGDDSVVQVPAMCPASQSQCSTADNDARTVGALSTANGDAKGRRLSIADITPGVPYVEAALAFHRAGFAVIPIDPGTKRTAVKWDPWLSRLSPTAIAAYWDAHPDHEVGCIVTDGLLVLDADGPESVAALTELERSSGVASNFVVKTRRGEHRYYRLAEGAFARTNVHSVEAHPERIDVKAAVRSMVVMAPSTGKTIVRCDIQAVADLTVVGQDFVDAVFRHNGCPPPRLHPVAKPGFRAADLPGAAESLPGLRAMLGHLDPDGGYDDWLHVGMGVHHAAGGSEEGFAIWNDWSASGRKYPGERELRLKWRSFDGYTGTPVTAGTIRAMLERQGKDPIDITDAVEPQFEPLDEPTVEILPDSTTETDLEAAPASVLAGYSITKSLPQLRQEMVEQKYVLDGIAILGQICALYAAANTGKTLLVLWLLLQSINRGWIDPSRVVYINCDDSLAGLVQKGEIAAAYGFHMVADGYEGFEINKLRDILLKVMEQGQARGAVLVLDTLKKFTDLMDKRTSSNFMKLIRRFVLKGGTVILLAHTNKNPGPDGRPVYEGTADVVNDADCSYTMRVTSEAGAAERIVEFERKKGRGNVHQRATFAYNGADGLTYDQLLASVRNVDDDEVVTLQVAAKVHADANLIETAKDCIREGIVKRMELIATIAQRTQCGQRKARDLLDQYNGHDILRHHWTFDVQERGAKVYRLLGPPDANPASEPREAGHE